MEMQCSRLMKKVWGNKVDEKREGAMEWHWLEKETSPEATWLAWETSAVCVNTKVWRHRPEL